MLIEIVSTLVLPGSGFLFTTLFGDLSLLIATTCILTYLIIPFFKARNRAKLLDKLAGSDAKHWLYGHTKKYGFEENGLLNTVERTKSFRTMFNFWLTPAMSIVHLVYPDVAITLLSSGAPKNEPIYGLFRPWIGDGLLTSNGEKWKRHRRLLTPAFHFSILEPYTAVFNSCARTMLDKWEKTIGVSTDVSKLVSLMTLDTMMQCAMSSETNCQNVNEHPYIQAIEDLSSTIITRLTTPLYFFDYFFYRSEAGQKFKKACDLVHAYAEKLIIERRNILQETQSDESNQTLCETNSDDINFKRRGKKLLDFLDILLQTKDEHGMGLTDNEIRDEVDTFLFEGHDTAASGISWALYNLAKYPEYQEKCREEVISIVGEKANVEWNDLSKLPYLTMFLKESMRLYPPVPAAGRRLDEPLEIRSKFHTKEQVVLPKDTSMDVNIFALHRNIHVWNKPNVFDPERFSKENQAKRSPHAYLPFSAGSRNCIGQNFALNQIKTVLCQVLRRYRLELDEETPKPIMQALVILRSENGIWIKFKPITGRQNMA